MTDEKPSDTAPEAIARVIDGARKKGNGMTFCGGLAILVVQVPPHISVWLSGELSPWREALWIGAATPVVAGLMWLGFTLVGQRAPKMVKDTATGKQENEDVG